MKPNAEKMPSDADIAPYRVRLRTRRNASAPEGHRQIWDEWQVVLGRTVVWRSDFEHQARAAALRLATDGQS